MFRIIIGAAAVLTITDPAAAQTVNEPASPDRVQVSPIL